MGHPAISVVVSLASAYAVALAAYSAIRRRDTLSVVAVAAACVAILACLFIIPREHIQIRAITSLFNVDLVFRLIDFSRRSWRGELENVSLADYCRFLIPFPLLLVVFGQKNRRIRRNEHRPNEHYFADVLRLIFCGVGVSLGFILVFAANKSPALQSSFAFDHVTKLFIFILTVESLAQVQCGLERLVGYDTRPIIDYAFLAHTPAEFWRRWNNRVQPWLYWNVFLPSGGRQSPVRGICATFLFSAVLHELGFGIATSQITGYQFTFFLIQAPAVMLSPALDRLAKTWGATGIAIAHAVTFLWVGATSIFFFDGVDRVFPFFYASERLLP